MAARMKGTAAPAYRMPLTRKLMHGPPPRGHRADSLVQLSEGGIYELAVGIIKSDSSGTTHSGGSPRATRCTLSYALRRRAI